METAASLQYGSARPKGCSTSTSATRRQDDPTAWLACHRGGGRGYHLETVTVEKGRGEATRRASRAFLIGPTCARITSSIRIFWPNDILAISCRPLPYERECPLGQGKYVGTYFCSNGSSSKSGRSSLDRSRPYRSAQNQRHACERLAKVNSPER